jgi:hypothetical protein
MLNLPIKFDNNKNILLCGIGGGFDILGTIPLYYTLNKLGITTYFHSYTIIPAGVSVASNHCPEKYISEFLNISILTSPKIGVIPLRERYNSIIKEYNIDHIILLDCGVDSLMRGDEMNCGTIAEEFVNFAALKKPSILPPGGQARR